MCTSQNNRLIHRLESESKIYHLSSKVPQYLDTAKYLDTRKIAVIILNLNNVASLWSNMRPKGADGMTNSVDHDQTAQSDLVVSLICAFFVYEDLHVRKFRIISVIV